MRVRIVVLPTGEIGLFTEGGTFAQGKEQLARLLTELGAAGVRFSEVGDVEQHRHDDQQTGVLVHEGGHDHDR
jgi:hypothetical protein